MVRIYVGSYRKQQKLCERKASQFCGFSMNPKSFLYECFEQCQHFQLNTDEAKTATKVFPTFG